MIVLLEISLALIHLINHRINSLNCMRRKSCIVYLHTAFRRRKNRVKTWTKNCVYSHLTEHIDNCRISNRMSTWPAIYVNLLRM